jgi:drug/metabolite transporter (DMT)-like permease
MFEQISVWPRLMSPRIHRLTTTSSPALPALVAVTAVWGLTFVQVKDAVEVYPVMPFLALRFAIAALVLAPFAAGRLGGLGRRGLGSAAIAGALLAGGYTLQTLGLERTSVSSAGFVTGMYVVLTPLIAFACFHARIGRVTWAGVALATLGLALLAGVHAGQLAGNLLVLAGAAVYSLQIVLMERYAPRYDALGFTLFEMVVAFAVLGVAAVPTYEAPRGWTVWGALLVTGIFASALAFLVQNWAQRVTTATRTALVFTLEPVFAALFGYWLAGDRLGAAAWAGSLAIMAGIVLAGRDEAQVAAVLETT